MKISSRVLAVATAAALVASLAACSSSKGSSGSSSPATNTGSGSGTTAAATANSRSVDVGTGTPVVVKGTKLNIAFFSFGNTDTYLQANITAAQAAAKAANADLTVFNANLNPTTQLSQVQSVLASGKYNAIMIQALNGQQLCTPLTKTAPSKGIAVVVVTSPLCGTELKSVADQWVPGTVGNYPPVGVDFYAQWITDALTRNPTAKKIAVLEGETLAPDSAVFNEAIKQVLPKFPGVSVLATYNTNLSLPDGLAKSQTLLQAHPDVQLILSQASGLSSGAAKAISAAGKTGKIVVDDVSGAKLVTALIKDGTVQMTGVQNPTLETKDGVEALAAVFAGKPLPLGRSAITDYDAQGKVQIVDKTTIDAFTPTY